MPNYLSKLSSKLDTDPCEFGLQERFKTFRDGYRPKLGRRFRLRRGLALGAGAPRAAG